MTEYRIYDAYNDSFSNAYALQSHYVCTVCERTVQRGEACYHFEGETVCEDCCNAYVMDHYWYASPEDIK